MAKIKIIKARNYGHVDDDGIIRLKTALDGPFDLNDERAAELVADGVAVYADGQAYSADLKANELRKIAKDMGLTFKVGTSKADMIAAMDAVKAEAAMDAAKAEAVEDATEDDLPELDLDEVVQ